MQFASPSGHLIPRRSSAPWPQTLSLYVPPLTSKFLTYTERQVKLHSWLYKNVIFLISVLKWLARCVWKDRFQKRFRTKCWYSILHIHRRKTRQILYRMNYVYAVRLLLRSEKVFTAARWLKSFRKEKATLMLPSRGLRGSANYEGGVSKKEVYIQRERTLQGNWLCAVHTTIQNISCTKIPRNPN
jgi:hypothetical protein